MELILISESKLKIMLSASDMQQYALDCKAIDYDNTETRRAFWSILDEAKHKTGFDAASEKVFIQLYPSKEGGCEIYVTKLGIVCGTNNALCEKQLTSITDLKQAKTYDKQSDSATRSATYSFACLDLLLDACRIANLRGFNGESSAYRVGNKAYYLTINDAQSIPPIINSLLLEFSVSESNEFIEYYIKEHGEAICHNNAVKTLSGY